MKQPYRAKKIVLEAIKEDQRVVETPSRFPSNRFVLRKQNKQENRHQQNVMKAKTNNMEANDQIQNSPMKNTESQFLHDHDNYDSHIPEEYVQARDRRILFKYHFKQKRFDLQTQKERLNEWLGEMHFKIVSSSFNYFLSGDLTFQEVKVHCCQNLLLNILNFLQSLTKPAQCRQQLGPRQMVELLKHINQILLKNLAYMQIKYPLTKDSKPNKTLQSLISSINNMGNDEQDFILKSNIQFKLREGHHYTKQIMKLINFIIQKQSQLCGVKGSNKKQLTYFQYFYQTMERIFTQVYKPQEEVQQGNKVQQMILKKPQTNGWDVQQQKNGQKSGEQKHQQQSNPFNLFAQLLSQPTIEQQKTDKITKQQKQYKQKVMKYTSYLIGSKLSSNAEQYSQKDIQTEIFDVKNSSVLRILTKWTQQLQKKILNADENILKRPYRFKKNKKDGKIQFSKLSANQKNDLYQETKRRLNWVKLYNEELQQNYNQIESMLSSHLVQQVQLKNIPSNQYKVGYFCAKIQEAASSTLLSYLNKIIHILLEIPQDIKKNNTDQEYIQNIDINLITFKVADLFRCKIKSKESQIVRIFKNIKAISEVGEPFKIVRIKDRLAQGTRDILINILFKNIFLCQIQLAIQEKFDVKQRSYDTFSHFLYEVHRSRLGPIMESACTWAQFDQRVKIYRAIQNDSQKDQCKMIRHKCSKQFFFPNDYPFVCSLCQKFYPSKIGLIYHKKCVLCKMYYECSVCIYNKMSDQNISDLLNLSQMLGVFKQDFDLWRFNENQQKLKFPSFGLIINKQMKHPEIIFYQTLMFKYDFYIINLVQDKNSKSEYEIKINIIQKISGNFHKMIKKISQKYIIYEWKQLKEINKKFTPHSIQEAIRKEAQQRQEKQKKLQEIKKKKIQQLQKKRLQQMQKYQKNFKIPGKKKHKQQKVGQNPKQQPQNNVENGQKINKNVEKIQKYNENIFKRIETMQVRVAVKETAQQSQILVLGIYVKENVIREKLRNMANENLLQKLTTQNIQVLFLEDQNIIGEINDFALLNQAKLVQLRQKFQRITEIYLDNNYLEQLNILQFLKNLKVAHFSNNRLCNIEHLQLIHQITELILENNQIYSLDPGLNNKKQLVTLNLNRNKINELNFFSNSVTSDNNFAKLKFLHLSDNEIYSMEGLEEISSLTRLDLSYNVIQQILPCQKLQNLQELDLSNNRIQKMKGIKHYTGLKKLHLNHNLLKRISKEIMCLENLTFLFLNSNFISKIEYISQALFSLKIKIINLSHNRLTKMQGLDGLKNLQQLYLNNNEIRLIRNYFDLSKLIILDLSYNSIQQLSIDKIQQDLTVLKTFNIRGNILNDNANNHNTLKNKIFGDAKVQFLKKIDFEL